MNVSIAKWGNSAAVRLPKQLMEQIQLHIGDSVEIEVDGDQLIIKPGKPDLEFLLSQVTDANKHKELISDSTGGELL